MQEVGVYPRMHWVVGKGTPGLYFMANTPSNVNQAAAEEICVWEDGGPLVGDQAGAISQRETVPGSSTGGSRLKCFN